MYMISNWIVDGINNTLNKYTNDILEASYPIGITTGPVGEASIAVGTDEETIMFTCPAAGMVAAFNTGAATFTKFIPVGNTPMGICEGIPYGDNDKRAPYFVCNYDDDSVSIIKGGNVVQIIKVGNKPKSIATDGYGRIYVANFGNATVSVLAPQNDKYVLFKTIKVDEYPNYVAVNHNDDVYITCHASIIKIRKNNTMNKFIITGTPVSITGDKYGNMWATNITDNSVMKINFNEQITTYPCGGVGPVYISADYTGDVICLNAGDKTITRISESGSVTNTIQLDYVPMANGDFIGFMSRVNILDDIGKKSDQKIEWDDLSDEVKERIDDGGVDPETLILSSDNITYTKQGYENVTEVLDHLLYEHSGKLIADIASFGVTPNLVEKGTVVGSVTFDYEIENIDPDGLVKAEIDNGVGIVDLDGTTKTAEMTITSDTTFKMTLTNNSGNIGSKECSVKFDAKMYYGISSRNITTSEAILQYLSSAWLEDNGDEVYKKSVVMGNANGYLYFAVPSSIGVTVFDIITGSFRDSNWDTSEVSVTNAAGFTQNYTLFKSGYTHALTGASILVSVEHVK